ncbi:MAG: hypothetical protein I3273_05590 [Candidatus Moeniiplasma glomeromycotorum]|nr:hypothetical protein [Candidatus Moeniiplasma glomeromycotorum]MCE8162462.1 hypothetical protein [Candidatus Moeniiplasma glomeromycotorum]MCE8163609.1 hypothetical protein [Candidatus Moeniiplasma glomeromycotorum]MCE8166388.1 hypothetical protein [Candidatus Moeniiplasma glomeromycotorum]MCE8166870.1 hypothetical protein [Candidatus Moeniiplasma glomeromycotorum]
MKQKKPRSISPLQKYNRLFKFLVFDLSLLNCILMTYLIFLYFFAIFQLFSLLGVYN